MGRVREQDIINYYCNNSHNNVTIMDAHVNMVMLMDTANQRIAQPGLVGVMMWRTPMTMMTFVAVLAVIVTFAQVAR